MQNILVINPFGVGDVLFSTVMISAIKKRDPRCYIGYICNRRTKEILETNPEINEIFLFERDEYRALWKKSKIKCVKRFFNFWQEIKKRKFDMMLDLSLGKEYAFLCWLAGIRERRGFQYRGRGRFLTDRVPFHGFNDKPVSEYYLDLIKLFPLTHPSPQWGEGKGIKTVLVPTNRDISYIDNFLKESGVTQEDVLVGVAPGGGISFGKKDQERRRWPAEKFSEVIDRIVGRFGAKVILIWGPGEKDLVERIAGLEKKTAIIAPKTSIREMAALCRRCKIVICSEGGPLHIASSQGVKTISIFGPVDEKVYGPYPSSENHTIVTSNIECRPCYKRFKLPKCDTKKCIENISVNEVFNIVSSERIMGEKL